MQGNCASAPPSEYSVKSYQAPQCVLLLGAGLFSTLPGQVGHVWLSNLHLRSARPASNPAFYLMASCVTDAAKMWLTNCTFQGDGVGREGIRGVGVESGCRAYMSGASPHTPPVPPRKIEYPPALIIWKSVEHKTVDFHDNHSPHQGSATER